MDEETVIGFDAREMQVAYTTSWPPDRRERFLLTEALIKPLSIDIFVWPSLFAPSVTVVGGTDQINFYESDLQIPLQHRSLDNLWRDLGAMHQYLAAALQNRQVRYWEIAITEVMSSSDPEELIVHDVLYQAK
ncbi:MAG: hypothetical protein HC838_17835 [Spirulinaceae cyanobacterium RM2_2_10]|nr:hypothetical protein [Spirulinaceae cyanobacterium RM2_2_10]